MMFQSDRQPWTNPLFCAPYRSSPRRTERQVPNDSPSQVTLLLSRWRAGDREALDAQMPLVYEELRRLARHYLKQERPDHTLQSTALVHEA